VDESLNTFFCSLTPSIMENYEILRKVEYDAIVIAVAESTSCEIPRYVSILSIFGHRQSSLPVDQAVITSENVSYFILPSGKSVCVQWNGLPALATIVSILTISLACVAAVSSTLWQLIWFCSWAIDILLLLKLHFAGPGYVGFPRPQGVPPPQQTIELFEGVKIRCKSCRTCTILRPPRASHCRLCGCCVASFDHHCVLLGSCIGRDNIRYFVAFLWFTTVVVFATFAVSVSALSHTRYAAALLVIIVDTFCVIPVFFASVFYFVVYILYGVTLREWRRRGAPYVGAELDESWAVVPRPFNNGARINFRQLFMPV
jgi:hypothetical protein